MTNLQQVEGKKMEDILSECTFNPHSPCCTRIIKNILYEKTIRSLQEFCFNHECFRGKKVQSQQFDQHLAFQVINTKDFCALSRDDAMIVHQELGNRNLFFNSFLIKSNVSVLEKEHHISSKFGSEKAPMIVRKVLEYFSVSYFAKNFAVNSNVIESFLRRDVNTEVVDWIKGQFSQTESQPLISAELANFYSFFETEQSVNKSFFSNNEMVTIPLTIALVLAMIWFHLSNQLQSVHKNLDEKLSLLNKNEESSKKFGELLGNIAVHNGTINEIERIVKQCSTASDKISGLESKLDAITKKVESTDDSLNLFDIQILINDRLKYYLGDNSSISSGVKEIARQKRDLDEIKRSLHGVTINLAQSEAKRNTILSQIEGVKTAIEGNHTILQNNFEISKRLDQKSVEIQREVTEFREETQADMEIIKQALKQLHTQLGGLSTKESMNELKNSISSMASSEMVQRIENSINKFNQEETNTLNTIQSTISNMETEIKNVNSAIGTLTSSTQTLQATLVKEFKDTSQEIKRHMTDELTKLSKPLDELQEIKTLLNNLPKLEDLASSQEKSLKQAISKEFGEESNLMKSLQGIQKSIEDSSKSGKECCTKLWESIENVRNRADNISSELRSISSDIKTELVKEFTTLSDEIKNQMGTSVEELKSTNALLKILSQNVLDNNTTQNDIKTLIQTLNIDSQNSFIELKNSLSSMASSGMVQRIEDLIKEFKQHETNTLNTIQTTISNMETGIKKIETISETIQKQTHDTNTISNDLKSLTKDVKDNFDKLERQIDDCSTDFASELKSSLTSLLNDVSKEIVNNNSAQQLEEIKYRIEEVPATIDTNVKQSLQTTEQYSKKIIDEQSAELKAHVENLTQKLTTEFKEDVKKQIDERSQSLLDEVSNNNSTQQAIKNIVENLPSTIDDNVKKSLQNMREDSNSSNQHLEKTVTDVIENFVQRLVDDQNSLKQVISKEFDEESKLMKSLHGIQNSTNEITSSLLPSIAQVESNITKSMENGNSILTSIQEQNETVNNSKQQLDRIETQLNVLPTTNQLDELKRDQSSLIDTIIQEIKKIDTNSEGFAETLQIVLAKLASLDSEFDSSLNSLQQLKDTVVNEFDRNSKQILTEINKLPTIQILNGMADEMGTSVEELTTELKSTKSVLENVTETTSSIQRDVVEIDRTSKIIITKLEDHPTTQTMKDLINSNTITISENVKLHETNILQEFDKHSQSTSDKLKQQTDVFSEMISSKLISDEETITKHLSEQTSNVQTLVKETSSSVQSVVESGFDESLKLMNNLQSSIDDRAEEVSEELKLISSNLQSLQSEQTSIKDTIQTAKNELYHEIKSNSSELNSIKVPLNQNFDDLKELINKSKLNNNNQLKILEEIKNGTLDNEKSSQEVNSKLDKLTQDGNSIKTLIEDNHHELTEKLNNVHEDLSSNYIADKLVDSINKQSLEFSDKFDKLHTTSKSVLEKVQKSETEIKNSTKSLLEVRADKIINDLKENLHQENKKLSDTIENSKIETSTAILNLKNEIKDTNPRIELGEIKRSSESISNKLESLETKLVTEIDKRANEISEEFTSISNGIDTIQTGLISPDTFKDSIQTLHTEIEKHNSNQQLEGIETQINNLATTNQIDQLKHDQDLLKNEIIQELNTSSNSNKHRLEELKTQTGNIISKFDQELGEDSPILKSNNQIKSLIEAHSQKSTECLSQLSEGISSLCQKESELTKTISETVEEIKKQNTESSDCLKADVQQLETKIQSSINDRAEEVSEELKLISSNLENLQSEQASIQDTIQTVKNELYHEIKSNSIELNSIKVPLNQNFDDLKEIINKQNNNENQLKILEEIKTVTLGNEKSSQEVNSKLDKLTQDGNSIKTLIEGNHHELTEKLNNVYEDLFSNYNEDKLVDSINKQTLEFSDKLNTTSKSVLEKVQNSETEIKNSTKSVLEEITSSFVNDLKESFHQENKKLSDTIENSKGETTAILNLKNEINRSSEAISTKLESLETKLITEEQLISHLSTQTNTVNNNSEEKFNNIVKEINSNSEQLLQKVETQVEDIKENINNSLNDIQNVNSSINENVEQSKNEICQLKDQLTKYEENCNTANVEDPFMSDYHIQFFDRIKAFHLEEKKDLITEVRQNSHKKEIQEVKELIETLQPKKEEVSFGSTSTAPIPLESEINQLMVKVNQNIEKNEKSIETLLGNLSNIVMNWKPFADNSQDISTTLRRNLEEKNNIPFNFTDKSPTTICLERNNSLANSISSKVDDIFSQFQKCDDTISKTTIPAEESETVVSDEENAVEVFPIEQVQAQEAKDKGKEPAEEPEYIYTEEETQFESDSSEVLPDEQMNQTTSIPIETQENELISPEQNNDKMETIVNPISELDETENIPTESEDLVVELLNTTHEEIKIEIDISCVECNIEENHEQQQENTLSPPQDIDTTLNSPSLDSNNVETDINGKEISEKEPIIESKPEQQDKKDKKVKSLPSTPKKSPKKPKRRTPMSPKELEQFLKLK